MCGFQVSGCLTYSSVWFPSVRVSSISECWASKCSVSKCLAYPSAHISKCLACSGAGRQVSGIFGCFHVKVPTYPSAHISKCWVSKCLACSSARYPSAGRPSVLHIRRFHVKVPTYQSARHIQVSSMFGCSHDKMLCIQVSGISKCLACSSAHISKCPAYPSV